MQTCSLSLKTSFPLGKRFEILHTFFQITSPDPHPFPTHQTHQTLPPESCPSPATSTICISGLGGFPPTCHHGRVHRFIDVHRMMISNWKQQQQQEFMIQSYPTQKFPKPLGFRTHQPTLGEPLNGLAWTLPRGVDSSQIRSSGASFWATSI